MIPCCLRYYSPDSPSVMLPKPRGYAKPAGLIADYLSLNHQSVYRWIADRRVPGPSRRTLPGSHHLIAAKWHFKILFLVHRSPGDRFHQPARDEDRYSRCIEFGAPLRRFSSGRAVITVTGSRTVKPQYGLAFAAANLARMRCRRTSRVRSTPTFRVRSPAIYGAGSSKSR